MTDSSQTKKQAVQFEASVSKAFMAQALGVADDDPLVAFMQVCAAMRQGFEQSLNLQFKVSQLTPAELRRTAVLIREQFANPAWTGNK